MRTALSRPIRLGKRGPRVFPLLTAIADALRHDQGNEVPSNAHLARDLGVEQDAGRMPARLTYLQF